PFAAVEAAPGTVNHLANAGQASGYRLGFHVPHSDIQATYGADLGDGGAHEAGAYDTQSLYLVGRADLEPTLALGGHEQPYQVVGGRSTGQLTEGLAFRVEAGRHAVFEAGLDRLQRLQRRGIVAVSACQHRRASLAIQQLPSDGCLLG